MALKHALKDGAFKDASPLKTVERIKQILASHGLQTTEKWAETSVPYCYALRVSIEGTTFGANGKGLTEEFALASAYGELMERLQLGYLGSRDVQKTGNYTVNVSKAELRPAKALLETNGRWYDYYARQLTELSQSPVTAKEILDRFTDSEGNVSVNAYFNLITKETSYFPAEMWRPVFTTNGCAAGNSMEEAVVQALGEIVERNHKMRILSQQITLPDIPEEVLENCKAAYEIIRFVRSKGFRVVVKDASLGTKYPVICVCFVDLRSGKYHTHFGAYPIFEIALQRALTESFQGRNIENICEFENFLFTKADTSALGSMARELAQGVSEKHPSFFATDPGAVFNKNAGFDGKNNRALLKQSVDFFAQQGYDVLVRDSSTLGFPTCQVLVPGYSEVLLHRLSAKLDDHRYAPFAIKTLRDPSKAQIPDMLGLLMHMDQMSKFTIGISGVRGFLAGAKLSAELTTAEETFLQAGSLAYVNYALKKYSTAIKWLEQMISAANGENLEYLICVKRYLSLLVNRFDPAQIRNVLTFCHSKQTVEKLYDCISREQNPLADYILHCDMTCTESCKLYGKCCEKRNGQISKIIASGAMALEFEPFAENLRKLLK